MFKQSVVLAGAERPVPRRESNPLSFLQQKIDRLFDGVTHGFPGFVAHAGVVPNMGVSEADKVIQITAELPGLEKKHATLNVAGNILTIRGEKKNEREEKDTDCHLVERAHGSFSRSIELPARVKSEDISVEIAKGALKVTVHKPTPAVSKQIEIYCAA